MDNDVELVRILDYIIFYVYKYVFVGNSLVF